jgi:hypothetical protein
MKTIAVLSYFAVEAWNHSWPESLFNQFTRVCHLYLSWARRILSMSLNPMFLRSPLIFSHFDPCLPSGFFRSGHSIKSVHGFLFSSVLCHTPCLFSLSWSLKYQWKLTVKISVGWGSEACHSRQCKVVSCPHHEVLWWKVSIDPVILDLGTRWSCVVYFILQPLYLWERTLLPTDYEVGWAP